MDDVEADLMQVMQLRAIDGNEADDDMSEFSNSPFALKRGLLMDDDTDVDEDIDDEAVTSFVDLFQHDKLLISPPLVCLRKKSGVQHQ